MLALVSDRVASGSDPVISGHVTLGKTFCLSDPQLLFSGSNVMIDGEAFLC